MFPKDLNGFSQHLGFLRGEINIHINNNAAAKLYRTPINREASRMSRKNQLVNQKRRQLVEEAVIPESLVGGSFCPRQGLLALSVIFALTAQSV